MSILTSTEYIITKNPVNTKNSKYYSNFEPILVLVAKIIHGRKVLDVSLTQSRELFSHAIQDMAEEGFFVHFLTGSVSGSIGQPQRPCHL